MVVLDRAQYLYLLGPVGRFTELESDLEMTLFDEIGIENTDIRKRLESIWGAPRTYAGWRSVCDIIQENGLAGAAAYELWRSYFAASIQEGVPVPVWTPNPNGRSTNVSQWAGELGIENSNFHAWTVANREQFWEQGVQRLGIRFRKAASRIADSLGTADRTRWFSDSSLNIVDSCFQADDDAIAVVSQRPNRSLVYQTYGELRAFANRVSNSVLNAGFQPGDGLAVVMPMTQLSVGIYLGVVQAGCQIVSIADSFAPPEIATRLEIAGAKGVFTYDYQERAGKEIALYERVVKATELPIIQIPLNGQSEVAIRKQDMGWDDFLVAEEAFESLAFSPESVINVLFSSGTTGDPKAIPWTQLTPIKCGIDGYCHQDIQPGDVCGWPTNLGWMMGPWLIFASLLNRATIALYEDAPMGFKFGQFVESAKVTMLGVVPTLVKTWRKSKRLDRYDWSAIRCFSSTGEASQRDDMAYLSAMAGMKPIVEYCGGTEIGGGYVTSLLTQPNFPAAFNSPAVGVDFVLLDEEHQESSQGEVFLEGPSIGLSNRLLNRDHDQTYFGDTPELGGRNKLRRHGDHIAKLNVPGWFKPLFVAGGRVDDTMNLGGIKVSSSEIERVLNLSEGVVETAAVAVQEEGGPSQLVVCVVLDEESKLTDSELRLELNQRLRQDLNPLFKIQRIEIVKQMPRTASGKLMRRELRTMLSNR